MSFAPQQHRPGIMPPVVRRVLYWALMIAFGALLWELDSQPGPGGTSRWMMLFVAGVTVLLIWVAAYMVWKKIGRRRPTRHGPANRPLG